MTELPGIQLPIYQIRKHPVVLDSDLAAIYGVQTKVFNQAFKRNQKRFPADFAFQLNDQEWASLRSQIVTLKPKGRGQHRKYLPWVFTEHGVLMAGIENKINHLERPGILDTMCRSGASHFAWKASLDMCSRNKDIQESCHFSRHPPISPLNKSASRNPPEKINEKLIPRDTICPTPCDTVA
jgi:hypothetical protein